MLEKVRIFTGPGCAPCDEVKAAVENDEILLEGLPEDTEVEMVDATSEEGYPFIDELGLDRVPVAYHGTAQCQIIVDDETKQVTVKCPPPEEPDEPPGSLSPGPQI